MKSSGPCLPSPPVLPRTIGVPTPPLIPLIRASTFPTVDTCTLVIAGERDMRLVPSERKRCRFPSAIFLTQPVGRRVPSLVSSPVCYHRYSLFLSRFLALLIPLGINSLLSIFRERIPDFLIAIDVSPDRRPLSPHLHAAMYPFHRFSCLKFRSYTPLAAEGFLDFSPLKSMPVCSRPFHHACSLPACPPRHFPPLNLFLRSFFSARPGYAPDFRCHCRFPSVCANVRRTRCASANQSHVPFFALLYPVCHFLRLSLSSLTRLLSSQLIYTRILSCVSHFSVLM